MFNSLINVGLDSSLPSYLYRKVQSTNVITLLLLFVIAIPFVFITLLFLRVELTIYPALGGVVCIGVLVMNYYGGIYFSRLIISILPISLGAIYNAYLSGPADGPIPSLYLIELSFALIPFVIFDLQEKGFLLFTLLICLLIIVSFPVTKNWFTIESDSTILRDGWLGNVTILLAIINEFGCVMGLAILNKQSEKNSEKLLKDMDVKNEVLKNSDVELRENVKKLEQAQIQEQNRNWTSEGLAKLSMVLRSNGVHGTSVYDEVLAGIVKYIQANQGGLYVVDTNEEGGKKEVVIKLVACYAYSRKKYVEGKYSPGQGLIGQTYLEKQPSYLSEIPADYLRITSGLGEATPKSLLIVPLLNNDVVEGILELASFHKFAQHQIAFIEKMAETLAAYIQTHRNTEHTNKLLQESLQLAEQMRAQEEEMRQNMEELAATQEEFTRKELNYQRQIEELTQALYLAKPNH